MVWVKCTTSVECKTIQIVESSVMDSWKALLRPMCKVLSLKIKQRCFGATIPKGRCEVARRGRTMTGYGRQDEVLRRNILGFLRKPEKSILSFFNKDMEMSFSKQRFFLNKQTI